MNVSLFFDKAVLLLCLTLMIALNGCSPEKEESSSGHTGSSLLNGLTINSIDSMVITDRKGSVTLQKNNSDWIVGESINFPVHMPMLIDFLVQLEETQLGQRMNVSVKDYAYLNLLDPESENLPVKANPIKVELFSNSGKKRSQFILGSFDIPDDTNTVMFLGEKGSARRFIRVLNDDVVYLSPTPLYSAVASRDMWIIRSFLPSTGVKEVIGSSAGIKKWSVKRKSTFGKLECTGSALSHQLSSKQVNLFNKIFSTGRFAGVVPQGREKEFMQVDEKRELKIISFDGRIHRAEIGRLIEPVDYRDPSKNLGEGIISFNHIQTTEKKEAYVVQIRIDIPSSVKYDNALVKPFEKRAIILEGQEISPLLDLFEQVEKDNNKTL